MLNGPTQLSQSILEISKPHRGQIVAELRQIAFPKYQLISMFVNLHTKTFPHIRKCLLPQRRKLPKCISTFLAKSSACMEMGHFKNTDKRANEMIPAFRVVPEKRQSCHMIINIPHHIRSELTFCQLGVLLLLVLFGMFAKSLDRTSPRFKLAWWI